MRPHGQRQLGLAGVADHRLGTAQEGDVEHAPRNALQDLVAPALGLEHLCVCGLPGAGSSGGSATSWSRRRMIAREPTSRSPPMRRPGTVVPP